MMNDITLSLVVILATGLLVILIFVLVRRNRTEQEKQLKQMALERGWKLELVKERLVYGQRIHHRDWVIELLTESSGKPEAEGSSNVTASTVWKAPVTGSTVLVGPRTTQISLGGLGESITRQLLQMALGEEAEGLEEVKAGSQEFQKRYTIWAKDPELVMRLINPFFESTLLSWAKYAPMIKRTAQGLRIELRNVRLKKPEEIDTLAKLGEFLLAIDF
jgi:hypothetical protein